MSQFCLISSISLACLTLLLSSPFAMGEGKDQTKLKQSQIKGLLVVQLDGGDTAGTASQMNATVTKKKDEKPGFEVGFNQEVGEMMEKATVEVEKFISVRHSDHLPENIRIEFAFSDKYSPKDGPSAAVACALMADSILSGKEINPGFAVTGDMTAVGDVRPVGGVRSKISGAIRKKCTHIGVPKGNENTLSDSYLLDGLKPLYSIQVFSVSTFDQAVAIAHKTHSEDIQKAMDEFSMVQKALKKNENYVSNAKVREKLRTVYKLAPNHLSARLLLLHSLKKGPKKLSLEGSISSINKGGDKLSAMLQDRSWLEDGGNEDVLFKFQSELTRLRPMLDKRTVPYADSYSKLANFFKDNRGRKRFTPLMDRELTAAIKKLESTRRKLYNDPDVREELMTDE